MLSTWFFDNAPTIPAGFSPSLDLHETDTDYEIKVDLPGLQANDIQVQLSENVLTISGERKYEKTDDKDQEAKKSGTTHLVERFYGSFTRSIMLPGAVKQDAIDATYRDGVLCIKVPKAEQAKPAQIPVKS